MKNATMVPVVVLLAVVALLLWRLERNTAPLAELARVQLADRTEARAAQAIQLAAAREAEAQARAQAEALATRRNAEQAASERAARLEAARIAKLAEPVKPGEIVPEITLDNRSTVRDATVVAVQGTSVSFKSGSRLYNIPTEQLPADLQARIRRMFPSVAAPESTEPEGPALP